MGTTTQNRKRLSIDQKLAETENKLARLRTAKRKLADGQKIIAGGMVIALALQDQGRRKQLIADLEKHITRDADLQRILPLLADLKSTQTAV